MPWHRVWDSVLENVKVQSLQDSTFRAWSNLLCAAARFRSGGELPPNRTLAFWLRMSVEELADHLKTLVCEGLIDEENGKHSMHDWNHWQPPSDTSTVRSKKQRKAKATQKQRRCNGDATAMQRRCNGDATGKQRFCNVIDTDTDTESDTDTEQIHTPPAPPAGGIEGGQPAGRDGNDDPDHDERVRLSKLATSIWPNWPESKWDELFTGRPMAWCARAIDESRGVADKPMGYVRTKLQAWVRSGGPPPEPSAPTLPMSRGEIGMAKVKATIQAACDEIAARDRRAGNAG